MIEAQQETIEVLKHFEDVFADVIPDGLPPLRGIEH